MRIKMTESFEAEIITKWRDDVDSDVKIEPLFLTAGQTYEVEAVEVNQELKTATIKFEDETAIYGVPSHTFEVIEL